MILYRRADTTLGFQTVNPSRLLPGPENSHARPYQEILLKSNRVTNRLMQIEQTVYFNYVVMIYWLTKGLTVRMLQR